MPGAAPIRTTCCSWRRTIRRWRSSSWSRTTAAATACCAPANALIAHNFHEHPKTLWSDQPDGERIRVWECRDNAHEAEKVASEIHFIAQKNAAPWSDFCILFRGNHQSRPLEKAMQLLRIPYHLSGGTAFLERQEVKDTLAWLRLIANPDDDAAFLRAVQAPKREVGATTLAKLAELAHGAHMPMSRAAESVGALKQLAPRAANALDGFVGIVRSLRADAQRLSPAELVRVLGEKSGMLAAIRAQCKDDASFQRRKENLEELAGWFDGGKGSGPGELAAQLACSRTRQGRRRQPGAADVDARRQGPGVPLRLHRRLRGRHAAARDGAGGRQPRRGTPPALRRHHPRQGAAVAVALARRPRAGATRCG
jgi:ATP-dependent exoDNAse (exonuclease V) beta subunit